MSRAIASPLVRPRPAPRACRVAPRLAAALLVAAPCAAQPVDAATPSSAAVRTELPAAAGWRLRALDGRVTTLGALRGRPVVLNVWASWCPPCVAELRSLQALHDSLAAEGVAVVLVSPEAPATVRAVLARRRITVPAFVEAEPAPAALGVRALPTTIVLDREGRVALVRRGAAEWDQPAVRAWLRALRSEPAADVATTAREVPR